MAVPMDNSLDQSSTERVQRLLNKNVELENKRRKAAQARIPSDPSIWQQMRENYEAIILENSSFSEKHEIEYALWQLHYRRIEELRAHFNAALTSAGSTAAQNGKGPARGGPDRITKIRAQFKTFLSEATGFYYDLMMKIRAKHGLPLGYFSEDLESQILLSKDGAKSSEMKKDLMSCHRCLIYLGDLARYKGLYGEGDSKTRDFAAASSYYMQACSLWPSSGNPHHQLAIVASYSGDELVAIYRYFRSLAVDTPFTTARDNLIIAFEKNRQSYSQLLGEAKASATKSASSRMAGKGRGKGESRVPPKSNKGEVNTVKEKASSVAEVFKAFSTRFVRLNGILFTRTSLETFAEVLSVVRNDLLELLPSGPNEDYNFGSDAVECRLAIVRLIAILIFTVHNVNKESENQSYAEILQRSVLLQNSFTAIFDVMGLTLERCSQSTDPSVSYLLPGIMIFVEWLASHQDIAVGKEVEEKQASARLYFWNHCITFFNKLLEVGSMFLDKDEDETCFFNMTRYYEGETANRVALSEDFELRGFLPLVPAQLILDFSRKHSFGSDGVNMEKKARIQRIIAAGKALANVVRIGEERIYFDVKLKKFVIGSEPHTSDDYILNSSVEVPELSIMDQGSSVTAQMSLGTLQPKLQLYTESEEEDEVIVFKPSMTEKQIEGVPSNFPSSEVLASGIDASKVDLGIQNGSLSAGVDAFLLQNVLNTNPRPPTSVASSNAQYLQPSTSKWLAEQAPVINGLANMDLLENGPTMKSESQNHLGALQPAAFSVPFPQSISLGPGYNYPVQVTETGLPSSVMSSVMSSGAASKSLSFRQSPITSAAGAKKNPVSRPIRHSGPPPGFGSVPSKPVDESSSVMPLRSENSSVRLIDDYSWLDGYQYPSSNSSNGFHSMLNSSGQAYSNSSKGVLSFPFPGKQMSTMQVQMENPIIWQDNQFSEQIKLHQEQQQQLQRGNQPSVALPQQYQGQSLWEGRFFV